MMRTIRIALLAGAAAFGIGAAVTSSVSAAPMSGSAINETASASSLTQHVWWDRGDWRWRHRYWRDRDDYGYHRRWWWHRHYW